MIEMTNQAMQSAGDASWPSVGGWDPIPWADVDPDWPVPEWQAEPPAWATEAQWASFTAIAEQMRSAQRVAEMETSWLDRRTNCRLGSGEERSG